MVDDIDRVCDSLDPLFSDKWADSVSSEIDRVIFCRVTLSPDSCRGFVDLLDFNDLDDFIDFVHFVFCDAVGVRERSDFLFVSFAEHTLSREVRSRSDSTYFVAATSAGGDSGDLGDGHDFG